MQKFRCITCNNKFEKKSSKTSVKCPKCGEKAYWQGAVKPIRSSGSYSSGRTDKQLLEHISTPFWLLAGNKPKPHEERQLKYMKSHNLTWTDVRKLNQLKAKPNGALERYQDAVK